jgi:uncharacterized protein YggU (UPF0235/DUF167 family)
LSSQIIATTVRVRAVPGSRVDQIMGRYDDGWKIRVVAAADRGKANIALCTYLARTCGVDRADVEVIAGHTGRDKLVRVRGVSSAEIARMLDAASGN